MQAYTKVVAGILQPANNKKNYKYKLITEDAYFYLDVPRDLLALLARHTWERIVVKGYLKEPNVLCVKTARLEKNEAISIQDITKNFDLEVFRKTINQGFSLQPMSA